MKVVRDELLLCADCLFPAVYGDFTSLDAHYSREESERRMGEIQAGLERLGRLVTDFDSDTGEGHEEFSRRACDCCGTHLAGERHRFAVLGPETFDPAGEPHAR